MAFGDGRLRTPVYLEWSDELEAYVVVDSNGTPIPNVGGTTSWDEITGAPADNPDLAVILNGKQPLNAKLTALAGLGGTAGLIENTGASTVAVRLIGVANASDVPARSDVDTRFARVKTSAFGSDGADGDYGYRPDLGAYQLKAAGVWADASVPTATGAQLYDGTYPAATHIGRSRFVTTWGVWTINEWFTSDGTSWFPSSRVLILQDSVATAQVSVGAAVETIIKTDSFPANMLAGAGRMLAQAEWVCVGTAGTHQPKMRFGAAGAGIGGSPWWVLTPAAVAADIHQACGQYMTFISNASQYSPSATDGQTGGNTGGATARSNFTINVVNACEVCHTYTNVSAADTVSISHSYYEIIYPSRKT